MEASSIVDKYIGAVTVTYIEDCILPLGCVDSLIAPQSAIHAADFSCIWPGARILNAHDTCELNLEASSSISTSAMLNLFRVPSSNTTSSV